MENLLRHICPRPHFLPRRIHRSARSLGGGPGAFLSGGYLLSADSPAAFVFSSAPRLFSVTGPERERLRHFLHLECQKTRAACRRAGAPFRWGRGLDLWVEHLKEAMPLVTETPAKTAEENSLTIVGGQQRWKTAGMKGPIDLTEDGLSV